MNVICCSGGNDSVALIQFMINKNLDNATVVYNQTGWEAPFWMDRISKVKDYCLLNKFNFKTIKPELLFKDLVIKKKGFPMAASNMQWCSLNLKTKPTLDWLSDVDPDKKADIFIGIRREESLNRSSYPGSEISEKYDGRVVTYPLIDYSTEKRNKLIDQTPFEVLPHSSMECFPCINSNRKDFRLLAKYPDRINELEEIEQSLGYTKNNKPRVMFRPYRHMGATGIREVVKWGLSERGKYGK